MIQHQYYLFKKYEIFECGDIQKLIRRRNDSSDDPTYPVCIDETFDVIKCDIATGHVGRDKMIKKISRKYANNTQDTLNMSKSFCTQCHKLLALY